MKKSNPVEQQHKSNVVHISSARRALNSIGTPGAYHAIQQLTNLELLDRTLGMPPKVLGRVAQLVWRQAVGGRPFPKEAA